ncbi:unnamed protein product [Porites evermanni]|uniref:Uncharacterized protein n=1 Tax=Porites evermanni TaxID=104178 RepID=A0ABN8T2L0_9CNID|nr:unnamed protein product [Porites evermanni]
MAVTVYEREIPGGPFSAAVQINYSLGKTKCSNDSDCQSCGDETVICNFLKLCNYSSKIDVTIRNKPCYSTGLWKSACKSNDDCRCDEGNGLVCEDNECVEPPRTNKMSLYRHRRQIFGRSDERRSG